MIWVLIGLFVLAAFIANYFRLKSLYDNATEGMNK